MIAGIRHHDGVAMLQKNLGISRHPKPVVTYAMQEKDSIVRAVFIPGWAKAPGTENRPVPGLNDGVLKVCIELFGTQSGLCLGFIRQNAPTWVERPLRQQDSCDEAEDCITREKE